MCEIIDIRGRLHEAKIRQIAWKLIHVLGIQPREKDLVDPLTENTTEMNNWLVIISILHRCFPSPTLTLITYNPKVEDTVLELLIRQVNRRGSSVFSGQG